MSDRRPGYKASNSVSPRMNILACMESVSAELVKKVDCWSSSCLFPSHQSSTNTYVPHNKEWLKEKIYGMLKRQANSKQ